MKNQLLFFLKYELCKISNKKLKYPVLGFALAVCCSINLRAQITGFSAPPSVDCGSEIIAVEQVQEEIVFPEGEDHLWFSLNPDSTSYISITESVGNTFPDLSAASIFIGEVCEESIPSDTENIYIDSNNYVRINYDFTATNNYFIKLERSSEENYPAAAFKIRYVKKMYCPPNPFDICNLLKDGDFSNSISFPDSACHWYEGSGTPDIVGTYKGALMWWTDYPRVEFESIRQNFDFVEDQKYYLQFDISNANNQPVSERFDIYLKSQNMAHQLASSIFHNKVTPGIFTTVSSFFKSNKDYELIEFRPSGSVSSYISVMQIDNIIMREFKVDAGPDLYTTSCADAIQINVDCLIPGATYSWSPLSGIVGSSNVSNPLVKPHVSTEYTVTISYNDRGTIHTATDKVYVSVEDCCNNISQTIPSNYTVSDLLSDPAFSSYISGSTLNAPFSIKMAGDFYVDQDFTINDAHLVMEAGAEINISNGNKLTLNNSILEVCGNTMWNGIKVTGTSSEIVLNNTEIWEAEKGINSLNGGIFTVTNSLFDGNYYGIYVDTYNGYHSGTVKGSKFQQSIELLAPNSGLGAIAGIYVYDVGTTIGGGGITIGDASNANHQNIFNSFSGVFDMDNPGMLNGIIAYHSSVKIINNKFNGYHPFIIAPIVFPYKVGVRIEGPTTRGPKPNYDVPTATIGGVLPNEKNIFFNCSRGISIINITGVSIRKNDFTMVSFQNLYLGTGIYISNNSFHGKPIDIADNKVRDAINGIALYNLHGMPINIQRNEIYQDDSWFGTGISLTDVGPFNVVGNYIKNGTAGILAGGGFGKIESNDVVDLSPITYQLPPNYIPFGYLPNYGIMVTDGNVLVKENTISASSPTTNPDVFGISYEMTSDPRIFCNTIENVGTGMRFAGVTNLSGNAIYRNVMYNNHNGMVLTNNTVLRNIGYYTSPSDNEWTGTFTGYHTYTDGADGNQTTLYTRGGGLPYVPQLNGSSTPLFEININSTATGTVFACGDGGTEPEEPGFEFSLIVNNGERSASEQWLLEYQVYKMLLNDSIIEDPLAQNFKDSMGNTALGQALALMDSINQIAPGAEEPLLTIEGTNNMENNMVDVANTMLTIRINDQDTLLAYQVETLDSLAVSCPFVEGPAVYKARGILFNFLGRNYINSCEKYSTGETDLMRMKNSDSGEASDILVYPNPSKDEINISLTLNNEFAAQFIVYDYTGKTISDNRLIDGNNHIDISNLQSSIYFYKIIVNGKIKKSDKLVVL